MVKSGLEFLILKFTKPRQNCCCPVQKKICPVGLNLPGRLAGISIETLKNDSKFSGIYHLATLMCYTNCTNNSVNQKVKLCNLKYLNPAWSLICIRKMTISHLSCLWPFHRILISGIRYFLQFKNYIHA